MDNNRLTFGASAVFEDCLEVIRADSETGKYDFLKRSSELSVSEPTIGEYFAALAESGWIYPADHEAYSRFFDLSSMRERLKNGRFILNGIRVKPADAYLWTDIEFVCPKSCPQSIFIFIRDLKRVSRPALNGYRLLMRTDSAGESVYPIVSPFGEFDDVGGALEYYLGSFGLEISDIIGGTREPVRADGFTLELAADRAGILAAVYETGAVSEERQKEVFEYYGKIDAKTGLYAEDHVKMYADMSEDGFIGVVLINAESASRGMALTILKRDHVECSFARSDGQLAAVFTGSESRLRHDLGALCRRLSDTGGDFEIKLALSARPASAEEVLEAAENSASQTPRDFRWSAAGTAQQFV